MLQFEGSQTMTLALDYGDVSTFCHERNQNGLMDENEEKKIVDDDEAI
jgi:hypothetical protein